MTSSHMGGYTKTDKRHNLPKSTQREEVMDMKLLTTGQAAEYCSVTPDTILKWIRSGFLPAKRTAGGHHRIDKRDLESVLQPSSSPESGRSEPSRQRPFRYCWEFNGNGRLLEACQGCSVYQMRALRCYEVVRLAPEANHPKVFCEKGSCVDCDYYQQVHEQSINVLVVSDDKRLARGLLREVAKHEFNMEITDCEYSCSAMINDFRPDFAVLDCSMGKDLSREICEHLCQDPRIPFVRVVLAGKKDEFPTACEKEVFARIQRPFSIQDIADCIRGASEEALRA